jgi:hypothetical protein
LLPWLVDFYKEVYIIVDGIDEIADAEEQRFLRASLPKLAVSSARVLVTSRSINVGFNDMELPTNEMEILDENHFFVKMDPKDVAEDIEAHLTWVFENDAKLRRLNLQLKEEIRELICDKHSGM